MFRKAISVAMPFTQPVVMSVQFVDGSCESGFGTITMINRDGWFLTSSHIFRGWQALQDGVAQTAALEAQLKAVDDDPKLNANQKKNRKRQIGQPQQRWPRRCSALWGYPGLNVVSAVGLPVEGADIAAGRLDGWDPDRCPNYAVIKDPTKDYSPGASLCKLGFPFHKAKPTYDEATNMFLLPPEFYPACFLPIEGILTRFIGIDIRDQAGNPVPTPFPHAFIETSSPGLRGQSGGPIFDVDGTVWAIQSRTVSYPLDLEGPRLKVKAREHLEHQFYNVGQGTHAETIIGLLNEQGVQFQLSAY